MIPYNDLCRALDIYNRKLRGEDVSADMYPEHVADDDFDIVESEDLDHGIPDVTAETAIPDASHAQYDSGQQYAQGYDSGQQYAQGYDPAQQQYAEGYDQPPAVPGAYPDDQDPNRQQ